jgi:dTDP-4-amino-4,6-dideoxygalactose transaminase
LELVLNYYRGRVALYAVLQALGIGRGDEVALQAFTCLAVPEAIMALGARPKYIDIENDGFNMDAEDLRAKLGPRTRAVIVQHTFGTRAKLDSVLRIVRSRSVPIVEDCCHLIPYQHVPHPESAASFFSFEWGKPVVAGIGGMAITADDRLRALMQEDFAQRTKRPPVARRWMLELQYHAFRILYSPELYWVVRSAFRGLSRAGITEGNFHPIGPPASREFDWRMTPAILRRARHKLEMGATVAAHAVQIASDYKRHITASSVMHPRCEPGRDVLARYPIRVPAKEAILSAARAARVELADWYRTPVHPVPFSELQSVMLDAESCPNAVQRCAEVVSLPINLKVDESHVERAAELINRVLA